MVALLIITISVTHLFLLVISIKRDGLDSPLSLMLTLNFIRVVPFALLVANDYGYLDFRVIAYIGISRLPQVFAEYLLIEWIGSSLVFFYLYMCNLRWPVPQNGLRLSWRVAIVFFLVGLVIWSYRIISAGGLYFLLENLASRSSITAGLGFLGAPTYICFAVPIVIVAIRYGRNKIIWDRLLFLFFLFAGMLLFASFGGRKNGMLLLLTGFVAWSVYVRPLVLRPSVMVPAVLVFFIYMNGVWLLRQPGGLELALLEPASMFRESLLMSLDTFSHLSYLQTYLVSIVHFQQNDFWYGSIFTSVPGALLPSALFPNKPPLDEGMYFRSLLEGYTLTPPVAAAYLFPSSTPPETFGNGYAFLGVVGALVFFAIKAVLFAWGWKLSRAILAPFVLVFLVYFLYGFEVSVLRLVQVSQIFLICVVVAHLLRALTRKSRRFIGRSNTGEAAARGRRQ